MSAFEADRFNHSRTSPENAVVSCRWSVASRVKSQRLPTALKERLQHFGATACQNASANLHLMIQLRMIHYLHHRMYGARFGIVRAIDQAFDPRMHQRARTHRARFNCNKQLTGFQTVIPYGSTRFSKRKDLGMSGRVGVCDVPVPSASNNVSVAHDHSPYRDLSRFQSALRRTQRLLHPEFVGGSGGWVVIGRSQFVLGVRGEQEEVSQIL